MMRYQKTPVPDISGLEAFRDRNGNIIIYMENISSNLKKYLENIGFKSDSLFYKYSDGKLKLPDGDREGKNYSDYIFMGSPDVAEILSNLGSYKITDANIEKNGILIYMIDDDPAPKIPKSYIPTQKEVNEINKLADYLANNWEGDFNWSYDIPKKYLMTMKDVIDGANGRQIWTIQPQDYSRLEKMTVGEFDDSYFDEGGLATTGSGQDHWIIYKPGLLHAMSNLVKPKE